MAMLSSKKVALIVAHPGDEALWAGGTILSHPSWDWFIVSLSRGGERDHTQKFLQALQQLGANGVIGDLDTGDDQKALNETDVKQTTDPVQTVASAKRSVRPGRKTVKLTSSQVAIAKKLGVPLEEYAKQIKNTGGA